MGLDREQVEAIRVAGAVHDLGKMGVPAEILTKPGQITDAEFALIKEHPRVGYELLEPIDFAWPVAEIVYQHHERVDGSGYPRGLSGDGIMIEARILSVADVVEAMASHRPYRPAVGIEAALSEISTNRGTLFDPEAADACVSVITEGKHKLTDT
jgi:HD-GYP domain-containing protein (c-di-GMP phosphodiesterase class II)